MSELQRQFGNRVRELRHRVGMSQEELAFRAGVHWTYLGSIERGERNPSLKNIASIAKALGVTLPELFSYNTTSLDRQFVNSQAPYSNWWRESRVRLWLSPKNPAPFHSLNASPSTSPKNERSNALPTTPLALDKQVTLHKGDRD